MHIIEEFIEGKHPDQSRCEDMIYKGERFIAVVDGATSKDKRTFDGKTSGRVAAEIVCQALSDIERVRSELNTPFDICDNIRKAFVPFYAKHDIDYINEPTKRAIASVVIYDSRNRKLFFVGDCQAQLVLVGEDAPLTLTNEKEIDYITSRARSLYIETLIKSGQATEEALIEQDLGREFIEPLLKHQMVFQNTEGLYAYECFDGTPVPLNRIKIVDLDKVSNLDKIILASDGYPIVRQTLEATERELHGLLKEDPLCYKKNFGAKGLVKGNYSFDDRSYISFKP